MAGATATTDTEGNAENRPLLGDSSPRSKSPSSSKVNNGAFDDRESSSSGEEAVEALDNPTGDQDSAAPLEGLPEVVAKLPVLVPAIGIGVFLCALDQLLAVATYAKIGSDLDALNNTGWIATAYFLTLTSCQPLYGRLSDIFGRKECLLFAYAVFGLGCLGCGLAGDMPQLVVARAVAGIGGGGMNAVVSILLTDIVPLADRGLWQGYLNIIFAAGTSAGGPLGGLIADSVGWRWAFLGQVPLCGVSFASVYWLLHLPPRPDEQRSHWREKLARIDFLGALVLVCAVLCLLLGLDNGGNKGWRHASAVGPLAASIVLFAAFVLVETLVATIPFAPSRVIFERSLSAAFACNFFAFAGHMAMFFTLPLLYQAVDGISVAESAVLLVPSSICGVLASLGAGYSMKRTGRYYWLTVASLGLQLLSVIPMSLSGRGLGRSGDGTNIPGTTLGLAATSLGVGSAITTTLIALISNAGPGDTAVVIACSYLFRSLGCAVGVSVGTAVQQQVLRARLADTLGDGEAARDIEERVRQSLDYIRELEPAVSRVVRRCYQDASVAAFVASAVFLVPGFIVSFYIREKKIKK